MKENEVYNAEESKLIPVSEKEFMAWLTRVEAYAQDKCDRAIKSHQTGVELLLACQRQRLLVEQARPHQVLKFFKNTETGDMEIMACPKPDVGFLPQWSDSQEDK